jgi:putative hydrolase of the HAD superfamily
MVWVVFDYGGVISSWPSEEDIAALAGTADVPIQRLADAYWQLRPAYDRADLGAPDYWRRVGLIAGHMPEYSDAKIAELTELDSDSWLHLQAGTVALIEELAAAGHRLAMLSNAPAEPAAAVAALPVARHFEHLMFSCELKAVKPDPECFAAALARLGAAATEVILVDDRAENVTAAASLGMRAVHFSSPGQVRALLVELLGHHRQ